MSASGATTPTSVEPPALDERDLEPRTPMKRLGSTRKLAVFSNIRLQLSEQARLLEARAEAAAGAAGELHDYCRRRAELEHEYARALDKLARAAAQRHKDHKHKREQWSLTGAYSCWQAALENTRALSRDHAALADLYGGPLAARLQRAADDVLRLHRKCKDIVAERHEEVGAALAEAAAGGKAHAAAATEWRAAALKLRTAHVAREQLLATDPTRHKKIKALDKELEKRRTRHSEARARALRARADYQLSLEAANATLQRYYLDDVADVMMCTEVGFEAVMGRVARAAGGAEGARARAAAAAAGALLAAADALDALADRQRFVAAHPAAFAPPRPLAFAGEPPVEHDRAMRELLAGAAPDSDAASEAAARDLAQRLTQLEAAARALRAECAENAKTLDAAEAELVRLTEGPDTLWDVGALFGPHAQPPTAPPPDDDARRDQEDYYLQKFRSYVMSAGRLTRVEARAAAARGGGGRARSPPRRAAPARSHFAAPLGPELPAVLVSCVRVIATYGVRQQGVFRVSGSASETAALRAAFSRGEDPLARVRDASDVNAVCGLLKQYVRELRPPLLPPRLQEPLARAAALPDAQFARRVRELLAPLPRPQMLVLRYLFAFLAHLARHSDRNMMDAWNLAICLGPTLLAAWGEGGAQVAAQNLVNELVKRTIEHHLEVFPQDVAPHTLFVPPPPHLDSDEAEAEAEAADGDTPDGRAGLDAGVDERRDSRDSRDSRADSRDSRDSRDDSREEHDTRDDLALYVDDDDLALSDDDDEQDERASCDEEQDPRAVPAAAAAAATATAPAPASAPASASASAAAAADTCRRLAESTPDLVLDLPARAADHFALDRDTLRRMPAAHAAPTTHAAAHRQTCSEGGTERREVEAEAAGEGTASAAGAGAGAGGAHGSPVPARNTLRVAAKFADLTLTGGSLKPALAAKPALLRRPTPHPAPHSAPAPAPPGDGTR